MSELAGTPATARGVETELLSLLLHLHDSTQTSGFEVSNTYLDDVRRMARAGVPAFVVAESVWRRHGLIQEAMSKARSDIAGAPGWGDLRRLTGYSELSAVAVRKAYERAGGLTENRAARQAEVVQRVLEGAPVSPSDEEVLGFRLEGHHVLATTRQRAGGVPDAGDPGLMRFIHAVSELLPGSSVVVVRLAESTVVWWSRVQPIAAAEVARMTAVSAPNGLRVAVGDPHRGVAGVARGYAEALRADAVARVSDTPRPLLHGDVLLIATLLADPDALCDLVMRELAGVLDRDRRTTELRETVLAFLHSGGSRQAVAEQLGIAPTTVAYRVERFETLRGRRLSESRLETWAALTVLELVPGWRDLGQR